MINYVLGFAFVYDHGIRKVVMIEQKRPYWQAGFLNGVVGKVNPEESRDDAMVRKFKEGTGYQTGKRDWEQAAVLFNSNFTVAVYKAFLPKNAKFNTVTDEEVVCVDIDDYQTITRFCVSNVSWLIPLCLNEADIQDYQVNAKVLV